MKQPTGPASAPLFPEREAEVWTCDACGARVEILVPARKESYPHIACTERNQGRYQP